MKTIKHFLIQNIDNKELFWDSEYGWVDEYHAIIFTETDSKRFNLPSGGTWFKLSEENLFNESDSIPF